MNFLLLLRPDNSSFDEEAVFNAVRELPSVERADRERRIDSLLEAHIWRGGDATIVRLSEDRTVISLSGTGNAAFFVAFELGRRLDTPIRVVDSDYTLDVLLDQVRSPADLQLSYERAASEAE